MNRKYLKTALAAIIGIPLMLIAQQLLLPRVKQPEIPPLEFRRTYDNSLQGATDQSIDARQPKIDARQLKAVYFVSLRYLQRNDPVSAECWMHYGSSVCRYPSIMLLYGDFCRRQRRYTEARRWIRLAGSYARSAGAQGFSRIVEQRLKELPPEVKQ